MRLDQKVRMAGIGDGPRSADEILVLDHTPDAAISD